MLQSLRLSPLNMKFMSFVKRFMVQWVDGEWIFEKILKFASWKKVTTRTSICVLTTSLTCVWDMKKLLFDVQVEQLEKLSWCCVSGQIEWNRYFNAVCFWIKSRLIDPFRLFYSRIWWNWWFHRSWIKNELWLFGYEATWQVQKATARFHMGHGCYHFFGLVDISFVIFNLILLIPAH